MEKWLDNFFSEMALEKLIIIVGIIFVLWIFIWGCYRYISLKLNW